MLNVITRPITDSEPDLLLGKENEKLIVTDLGKKVTATVTPPKNGWTHCLLEQTKLDRIIVGNGYELFLGEVHSNNWIGSSEL